MSQLDRICIGKTAWSQDYQGAPVYGRHEHVQRTRDGHEKFNFLPGPDGRYYVYLPTKDRIPDPAGDWLLLIVAAETRNNGRSFGPLRVVGWFEGARFVRYADRPEYARGRNFDLDNEGNPYFFSVAADRAHLIPADERTRGLPIEHGRKLGMVSLSFLRGPNVKDPPLWKKDYADFIGDFVRTKGPLLPTAAEVVESGWSDSYAAQEHRLRVEKAAEELAKDHFRSS